MSEFKLILKLVLIVALFYDSYCQQCRSGGLHVDPDKTNMKLRGPVIRAYQNMGPNTCYDECIRTTRCLSFNYNRVTLFCEINFMATTGPGVTFVTEAGTVFVEIGQYRGLSIKDPCSSRSCEYWEYCKTLPNNTKICVKDSTEQTTIGDSGWQTVLEYNDFFTGTSLIFDIKACDFADVFLHSSTGRTYDFLIGYDDTIEIRSNGYNKAWANVGDIISCDDFISFWISWGGGNLTAGTGKTPSNSSILITWQYFDNLTISKVSVSTRYGRHAKWVL